MKIFESVNLYTDDRRDVYCRLTFSNAEDRRRFAAEGNFRGGVIEGENANPYEVERNVEFAWARDLPLGDRQAIGFYTDPMALSRHAQDVLLPHIAPLVQLVPLHFDEGEYAAINITHVIDALDEAHSDIERFPSSGRISRILRHAFKPDRVKDELIFKIPQTPRRAFVTDRFVKLVNDAGLTGFAFEPVWSDAHSGLQALREQGAQDG